MRRGAAGSLASAIHRLSSWLALAVFVLAPLPLGSVATGWVALWCVVLAVSLATADFSALTPAHRRLTVPFWVAGAAFLGVALVQMWPDPPFATPHPIWDEVRPFVDGPVAGRLAVSASAPLVALGAPLLFMMALLRAYVMATDLAQARAIHTALGRAAIVYAVFSIVSFLAEPHTLLWREKIAYLTSLTGTFVNRNTAATYFGTAAIILLLPMLERLRRRLPDRDTGMAAAVALITERPSFQGIVTGVGFLICFGAMAMTDSRAGFLLGAAACGLVAVVYLARGVRLGRLATVLLVAFVLLLGVAMLELWGGSVALRVDRTSLNDELRMEVYRISLGIAAQFPVFGTGLGTFETVFPAYRSAALGSYGVWDRAHDTLIEIAVEMGLIVAGLVAIAWLLALGWLAVASFRRRRRRAYPLAALGAGLLAATHSLVDFSLQIPGYAVVLAAVAGAGLAQSLPADARRERPDPSPDSS